MRTATCTTAPLHALLIFHKCKRPLRENHTARTIAQWKWPGKIFLPCAGNPKERRKEKSLRAVAEEPKMWREKEPVKEHLQVVTIALWDTLALIWQTRPGIYAEGKTMNPIKLLFFIFIFYFLFFSIVSCILLFLWFCFVFLEPMYAPCFVDCVRKTK